MEFSIATLLAQFSPEKLVAAKFLEKKLDCEDELCIEKLQIILDALEKIGLLNKELGKYRRVIPEGMVEAKLRCSSKGFCFAIQDEEGADDIYVRESYLSNAWNGDRVLVKIIKEGSRRRSPEGAVQVILDRANPSLLARIKHTAQGYRAVPLDDRLLFEIALQTTGEELAEAIDHLVHVEILRYAIGTSLPLGRVTKILGSDAETAADTDIVACKHDLPQGFSEKVQEFARLTPKPAPNGKIAKAEINKRFDLRSVLTITLEDEERLKSKPPELIENAFSLEPLDDGQWLLGIHIADFAHYIEPGSPLDNEAKKRGTAVYLDDFVVPLFPDIITRRCSLVMDHERLAISILLTLDKTGQVIEFDIQPSVIKVDHQLSYQQVQAYLGQQEDTPSDLAEANAMLEQLFFTLAPLVKAQRLQRGGFDLHTLPLSHAFKDESRLGVITVDPTVPLRSMLMDVGILAGKVIADHCRKLELPALYCGHVEPDVMELEDFIKLGTNLDLNLDLDSEDELTPGDYQTFTQEIANSPAPKILTEFLKKTIKPVHYATKPVPHFGLAYNDGYCQVLAPGQRYGDLLMQRLLNTLFTEGRDRRTTRSRKAVNLGSSESYDELTWNVLAPATQSQWEADMHEVVHHLNERLKLAEDAENDLQGLKKAEKMKARTGDVFKGWITGVQSYGFFVEIEELMVEGLVHVSSLKDDWYEYRSRHSCLVGRKNRTAYRLGDRVEVQVKSVDYYRQQIDLVTVSGGSAAVNSDFDEDE
ncbi:ribonuclease R family protein [Spirulina sp. CCNP1310]|uniref:ribonuclease R family protein n=1 Tax=Spirulina sp. CCNP1310 TaxID=3110249 RepID=UPI002B1E9135|nr:ribonuclease R family protein [Spirulina sp. CCNP1310]MEA5419386.1 ribonuclease R family protein [Spirulina sp. CCNP1310]